MNIFRFPAQAALFATDFFFSLFFKTKPHNRKLELKISEVLNSIGIEPLICSHSIYFPLNLYFNDMVVSASSTQSTQWKVF